MKANKVFLFSLVVLMFLTNAPQQAKAGNNNIIDNMMYQILTLIMQPILNIICP